MISEFQFRFSTKTILHMERPEETLQLRFKWTEAKRYVHISISDIMNFLFMLRSNIPPCTFGMERSRQMKPQSFFFPNIRLDCTLLYQMRQSHTSQTDELFWGWGWFALIFFIGNVCELLSSFIYGRWKVQVKDEWKWDGNREIYIYIYDRIYDRCEPLGRKH